MAELVSLHLSGSGKVKFKKKNSWFHNPEEGNCGQNGIKWTENTLKPKRERNETHKRTITWQEMLKVC